MATVAVIGDVILDKNVFVQYVRHRESAPVYDARQELWQAGGAANVAINLVTLGNNVDLFGVVGNDVEGKLLDGLICEKKVNFNVLVDNSRRTSVRQRVIENNNKIFRVAYEDRMPITSEHIKKILEKCREYDALVVVDYQNGMITPPLIKKLLAQQRKIKKPIFIDAKPENVLACRGATIVKMNSADCQMVVPHTEDICSAQQLQRKLNTDIFLTRGMRGSALFLRDLAKPFLICNTRLKHTGKKIVDETGAGDTALAVMVHFYLQGENLRSVAERATKAGSVAVRHNGLFHATCEELDEIS